jgi:hypothetical protein
MLNVVSAGIKEGLYDSETLANYLLYRFNLLNPDGKLHPHTR